LVERRITPTREASITLAGVPRREDAGGRLAEAGTTIAVSAREVLRVLTPRLF
jgi:hypothetical protein